MKFEQLEARMLLAGDIAMYNDHISGAATHPFTTNYAAFEPSSGLLRDSATGDNTAITLTTSATGVGFENTVGLPAPGTDAYNVFNGWVDFSNGGGASIALSGSNDSYTHAFSGLNPDTIYDFAGTSIRGNSGYTNRWTLVTLVGAESFTPSHSSGVGIVTSGLAANQVALWTGENHLGSQGFVAAWEEIEPGADGEFEIVSQQYLGLTPGVGTGSAATGSKGYALTAVQLVERESNVFRLEASDPPNGAALTSAPTTYTVDFNAAFDPATVDASDLTVDGNPATAVQIIDADTLQFTLPPIDDLPQHNVAMAEGALDSSVDDLPLRAFNNTFALRSGSGVVINEVSYDPGDGALPLEYVELFNAGPSTVDLSGWMLDDAVSYVFADGTEIGSGDYLLVTQNPTVFFNFERVLSVGPFDGRLSNDGETVELRDELGVLQDEVDYQLGFPWPTIGDIPGESIQLINPSFENDIGGNWRSAPATPGAVNSVFALNAPPLMRQVNHSPNAPVSGQDVTVTMKITDPNGIASAMLEYQLVNPGDYIEIDDPRYATNWTSIAMNDNGTGGDAIAGDDIYTSIIPGNLQTHRRLVRFRVVAEDTLGTSVTAPHADDPQPNFAYFVYDATPDWTGAARPGVSPEVTYDGELLDSVATYHLITTRTDHVDAQHIPDSFTGTYGGSDYLWDGALVYDGQVYDHIRYRARGGVWRYAMGKNMWKFDFNRGHDFEARDNYGNKYTVDWNKLNLSAIIQQGDFWHRGEQGLFESVGFELFNKAGVESPNTNYVQFRIVEDADEEGATQYDSDFQGLYLAIEQLNGRFLDEHGLPDGNLYKMENGTGVGGIGGELNNQGDYPEVSDSSDLIAFKNTYESGTQTATWWDENLNLESYYSYRSIVEGIHHYDIGNGKNYFFYHNPETDKWETIPWDLDLTWANNMFGNGNEPFKNRVLPIPEFGIDYRNRMREIRDLLYNVEQVGWLVDETAAHVYTAGEASLVEADRAMWDYNPILTSSYVNSSKAGHGRYYAGGGGISAAGDFAGMMQKLKDYALSRGAWIDNNILTDSAQVPQTPVISYAGDFGFPVNKLEFTTSGFSSPVGSAFAAIEWRIAEISNPSTPVFDPNAEWIYEIDPVIETGSLSTLDTNYAPTGAELSEGHTYRARVRVQDAAGRWSHWSDPSEFVAAAAVEVPTLSITELHYNPFDQSVADDSDLEFIEILNTGSAPVSLAGIQLADFASTPYAFASGASLAPGEYMVVAREPAIFTSVYGAGINLAEGNFSGSLSNGGELVGLYTASGVFIQGFTYDDQSPWPTTPDGSGPSLEIIDPLGDHTDPTNWRASSAVGGSPGASGDLPGDYNRNGTVDQLDYTLWKSQVGQTAAYPGAQADGNADGVVSVGDYTLWRDNLGLSQPAGLQASAALIDADNSESAALATAWATLQIEELASASGPTKFSGSAVTESPSQTELLLDRYYADQPADLNKDLVAASEGELDSDEVSRDSLEFWLAELGDYFPQ